MNAPQTLRSILRALGTPGPRRSLALLRILLGVSVLGSGDIWRAATTIPRGDNVIMVLVALTLAAAALTIVGLRGRLGRASAVALAVGLFVVVGLLQLGGQPIHIHHLVWMAVLVAAASDTDASAALTVRAAPVLLACVYFWPGVHKLFSDTTPFFDADALVRLVTLKAYEAGASVPFALDRHSSVVLAGGLGVIFLELAVLPTAVLWPRVAGAFVVVLHGIFWIVLHMPFTVLSIYALAFFLPMGWPTGPRPNGVVVVAGVLFLGIGVAGALGDMRGYPFACYPTFALPVPMEVHDLRIDIEDGSGGERSLTRDEMAPLDVRSAVLAAARAVDTTEKAQRFYAWRMRDPRFQRAVGDARRVRVVRVRVQLTALGEAQQAEPVILYER